MEDEELMQQAQGGEMAPEMPEAPEVQEAPKRGRDKFLGRMQEKNPEYSPEDDDTFMDDIEELYSEAEAQLGKYSESNQKLAELVGRDPKLGAVLSMLVADPPKSLPYAVAKVYGKEVFDLEGEELEEFETGYQENLSANEGFAKQQTEALENIEKYKTDLEAFGSENGLSDDEVQGLHDAIFTDADNFLMGIIPKEYIDYKYKGMNYDKDVQDAADTGLVEGRNEKIDLKKKDLAPLPDLNNTTGAGSVAQRKSKARGSFYDDIDI